MVRKVNTINRLPWFKFWTGDFRSKTDHLSNAEVGAYVRLLASYWDNNGLPDNERALTRIAKIEDGDDLVLGVILGEFFNMEDNRIRHEVLDVLRIEAIREGEANRRRTLPARVARAKQRQSVTIPVTDTEVEADVEEDSEPERESELKEDSHSDGRPRKQTHTQTEDLDPKADAQEDAELQEGIGNSGDQVPDQPAPIRAHQSVSLKPDGGAQGCAAPAASSVISGQIASGQTTGHRVQGRTATGNAPERNQTAATSSADIVEFTPEQIAEIDKHPKGSPERWAAIKKFTKAA